MRKSTRIMPGGLLIMAVGPLFPRFCASEISSRISFRSHPKRRRWFVASFLLYCKNLLVGWGNIKGIFLLSQGNFLTKCGKCHCRISTGTHVRVYWWLFNAKIKKSSPVLPVAGIYRHNPGTPFSVILIFFRITTGHKHPKNIQCPDKGNRHSFPIERM